MGRMTQVAAYDEFAGPRPDYFESYTWTDDFDLLDTFPSFLFFALEAG
jgi:hypothetical protein